MVNGDRRRPLILPSSQPWSEECAPRTDFAVLASVLEDAPIRTPPLKPVAGGLRQAIAALRHRRGVSVYVSLSEKIGAPLALLLAARRDQAPHVLVAHHLTSAKKRSLHQRTGWLHRFARIVVLSEPQAAYLREVGYPPEKAVLLPDSVDTRFWHSLSDRSETVAGEPSFVLSVGQERRDYATLLEAARDLAPLPFVIVSGSLWGAATVAPEHLPENVSVRRGLRFAELRGLYTRASVVVVPLEADTRYAAGANGLLEGMAMGKAVVLTQTPGLEGYARDNETVRIVPPSDPSALASAIRRLRKAPEETARLGAAARAAASARHSLDAYTTVLAKVVREAESETR
ncbi:MAG: glycosyltransferase family 4 protein [Cytophagales bacterium]|nr:glycosyltransferase family 4 protein [Armatimonadota bacterium]